LVEDLPNLLGNGLFEIVERRRPEAFRRLKIALCIVRIWRTGQPYRKRFGEIAVAPVMAGMLCGFLEQLQAQTELALVFFVVDHDPHALRTGHMSTPW
jgi:hypothetical protein